MPLTATTLLLLVLVLPGLIGGERRKLGPPPPGGARIEILDVGQGDAILIRPAQSDPILIDGGPPGGDLQGALDSAGVERLAAVLLSHPDLDHYGGLTGLFGLIPVERFLYGRAPPVLLSEARSAGVRPFRLGEGMRVKQGEIGLEILWPPREGVAEGAGSDSDPNARSVVTLLEWRDFRMLLTGDAEAEVVPMDPGPVDVLKISHHGSADSGLPELLAESSPAMAVIPVGEGNSYGHPVPEVLAGLAAGGVATLRTDRDGTISIVLGRSGGVAIEKGR